MDEKEYSNKVNELKSLEANLQNILAQNQQIRMEQAEVENALREVESSKEDDVYQVLSGLMIKADKEKIAKDLREKNKVVKTKLDSVEKQQKLLEDKASKLRKDISNYLEKARNK